MGKKWIVAGFAASAAALIVLAPGQNAWAQPNAGSASVSPAPRTASGHATPSMDVSRRPLKHTNVTTATPTGFPQDH